MSVSLHMFVVGPEEQVLAALLRRRGRHDFEKPGWPRQEWEGGLQPLFYRDIKDDETPDVCVRRGLVEEIIQVDVAYYGLIDIGVADYMKHYAVRINQASVPKLRLCSSSGFLQVLKYDEMATLEDLRKYNKRVPFHRM